MKADPPKDTHLPPAWSLARLALILLAASAAGCVESYFKIPYPPGARPSKLWAADPRTTGWNGVEVEYALLTYGGVEARVCSADGRHQFKQRGESWYEDERGQPSHSYQSQEILVVRFDGREERYRFVYRRDFERVCIELIDP
jgi:hypothetical protein